MLPQHFFDNNLVDRIETKEMHRSVSLSRVAEEYYAHAPSVSSKPSNVLLKPQPFEVDELLTCDPNSDMSKKEKTRVASAENAVHLIPLVLLLCAVILWLFSNPDVNVGLKGDSIAARIEGLTIEGDIDSDSDGTQSGGLSSLDVEDTSQPKQTHSRLRASRRILASSFESRKGQLEK